MKKILILSFLVITTILLATQMIVHTTSDDVSFDIDDIEQITFEIDGTIIVTNPDSSTIWYQEGDFFIEWSNAEGSQVLVELYHYGEYIDICHPLTDNDDICHGWVEDDWGVGDNYEVKVLDTNGNYGWSEEFSISEDTSTIIVTNPNSSTIWYQGEDFYIEWENAEGSQVLVKLYHYGVYIDICHPWTDNDDICHGWVEDDWGVGDYYKVKVLDTNGNYGWSDYFTISE